MFKLPNHPSSGASAYEIADFAEILAWINKRVSIREIVALLGREGENDPNVGCEDIDDQNSNIVEEAFEEIQRRCFACNGRYPFSLDKTGNVLDFNSFNQESTWIYGYLLLSTRLNMKNNRNHGGVDGTTILEEISAEGLKAYLGKDRAKSLVFGTSAGSSNFQDRVTDLCNKVGEGIMFRNTHNSPMNAKDDKLDVVAWLPFADTNPSKIIIFAQCKTGTAWAEQLCQLRPESFIKKWINNPFVYDPIRAYIVSEAADQTKWSGYGIEGGLFFDRCRLMECCIDIKPELFDKLKKWSDSGFVAAKKLIEGN